MPQEYNGTKALTESEDAAAVRLNHPRLTWFHEVKRQHGDNEQYLSQTTSAFVFTVTSYPWRLRLWPFGDIVSLDRCQELTTLPHSPGMSQPSNAIDDAPLCSCKSAERLTCLA